jgi:hypothetical protein
MRIAIFGQKEHGKTTTAKMIRDEWRKKSRELVPIISFSEPLKQALSYLSGWPIYDIMKSKESKPTGWGKTVRETLQRLSDVAKECIHKDILIIRLLSQYLHFIIDDGRYEVEAKTLQSQQCFNILIYRSGMENSDPHSSETWLAECYKHIPAFTSRLTQFDFILLNNGTLENLREKVNGIVIPRYEKWVKKLLED